LDGESADHMACNYTAKHNIEKRRHTAIPRAGFEPMITMFDSSKTKPAIGTGSKTMLL